MSRIEDKHLASITVSYFPDVGQLARQLAVMPSAAVKVVVDNGSPPGRMTELRKLASGVRNVELIELGENIGLAAATNVGLRSLAGREEVRWVLLLDQDTEPMPGAVDELLSAASVQSSNGETHVAFGPSLLDPFTGMRHGFHQMRGWRYRRLDPGDDASVVPCIGLNGSGTLLERQVFEEVGGLRDEFFIDHVDTEFCFRLAARGVKFFGVPRAVFKHSMGQSSIKVWCFGWHLWPVRSPRRLRYLCRNTVALMRLAHVPPAWKFLAALKLAATFCVVLVAGPARRSALAGLVGGLLDGVVGRRGRIDA